MSHKVLSYLNLISVQPPRSTRSSVVTLSRPPTISSLKITDRLFRYASLHLRDQLPDSFRHPRQSCLDSPPHSLVSLSSLSSSPFLSSITPSLQAQNLPFQQILPTPSTLHCLHDHRTGLIMLLDLFLVRCFFNFSVCSVWWSKLTTCHLFTAR